MLDRSLVYRAIALLAGTLLAGCATPYTYYGNGSCGPVSLSGRFDSNSSCSDCASAAAHAGLHFGPGDLLKRTLTCAGGCGELYWGEWINDPPDDCDACSDHGDWMGTSGCCRPGLWSKLWAGVHGQRSGATVGTCADCGAEAVMDSSQGVQIDGLSIDIPPPLDGPVSSPNVAFPPSLEMPPVGPPAEIATAPNARHPQSRLVRKRKVRR